MMQPPPSLRPVAPVGVGNIAQRPGMVPGGFPGPGMPGMGGGMRPGMGGMGGPNAWQGSTAKAGGPMPVGMQQGMRPGMGGMNPNMGGMNMGGGMNQQWGGKGGMQQN